MEPDISHADMKRLLEENHKLLEENNVLLKKLHRAAKWGIWIRVFWYALLIGLPFAIYFYLLEPYFEALGSNYETFSAGIQEIPGFKHLNEWLHSSGE